MDRNDGRDWPIRPERDDRALRGAPRRLQLLEDYKVVIDNAGGGKDPDRHPFGTRPPGGSGPQRPAWQG